MKKLCLTLLVLIGLCSSSLQAEEPAILPLKDRAAIVNKWLTNRLETVLPELMRREKIDMWIVICREYNEDPVYLTLVPEPVFAARRTTMLVFYDRGEEGVERITVSRYGIPGFYKSAWDPKEMGQWEALAKVVKERNPKKIGINESETFAFGDGLTASLKSRLIEALGSQYASRLTSAQNLAVGWLETRTAEELEVYHHIVSIPHEIIKEAFSDKVITPGITTTDDVVWWFREKIRELKLTTWFQPSVDIQRQKGYYAEDSEKNVIHRGDILHCDVGIVYLRLNTDTQEMAYVLKENETDVPAGLKKALKTGNRLQDILTGSFSQGLTGNEILSESLKQMRAEGINGSIYTHPLGYHGHAAGPTIGLWDNQVNVPGKGDYPLFYNTCYSIELNAKVKLSEWDGQEVRIALEQDAVFTNEGVTYLDDRQIEFHIVK